MDVPRGRVLKRSRAMSKSVSASVIRQVVKRTKTATIQTPKFKLYRNCNLHVFPKQMRQTLKYNNTYTVAPTGVAGAMIHSKYRCNGPYDPEVAVGGHQPYGWDQLAAMYTKYVVVSGQCAVTINMGTILAYTGQVGINLIDPAAATVTDRQTAMESQYNVHKAFISTGGDPTQLKINFDSLKYFNVKDVTAQDDLSADVGSTPTREAYYDVWFANDSTLVNSNVLLVDVSYDVIFFEPREVASS